MGVLKELHQLRESRRLGVRIKKGKAYFQGLQIWFHNKSAFWALYKQIFQRHEYAIPWPRDAKPLRILDLGANIGLSVLYYGSHYPTKEIVCLEPDPVLFELLQRNVQHNQLLNVKSICAAAWTCETRMPFQQPSSTGGSLLDRHCAQTVDVQAVDARELFKDGTYDCVKMDIEGAEQMVLPHIIDCLIDVRFLLFEYHSLIDYPQRLHELLDMLSAIGFQYFIYGAARTPRQQERVIEGLHRCNNHVLVYAANRGKRTTGRGGS